MNFTLCKNRCNYTKRNKQSRNSPLSVQPFQNRTIPCFAPSRLPYERSVCFASALSHPLFVGRASACACTASYPHYPLLSTTSLPPLEKGEVLSPEKIRATTGGIAPYPHQSLLFPLIFAKEHLSLALLAPPVAPNLSIPATIAKEQ